MDIQEKLQHLLSYRNAELLDFDEKVFKKYGDKGKLYKGDASEEYLGTEDLLEIINSVCENTEDHCTDFTIMYDTILNKIQIRTDGEWEILLRDKGVKKVMQTIQKEYLDKYECFLIRKIEFDRAFREKKRVEEKLEEYYAFIGCFDMDPFVKDANDENVLNNGKYGSYKVQEKYLDLFRRVTNKLTKSQINKVKADVQDVLKRNTKRNIEDLNSKVMDLLRIDQDFKDTIIEKIRLHLTYG